MKPEEWKSLRKKWVSERDALGVSTGAVKGVSVGDAIENVYKASLKDYWTLSKALTALLEGLKQYKAGILKKDKDKNKKLVAWLEKNVEGPAKELHDGVGSDCVQLDSLKKIIAEFFQKKSFHFPDGSEFDKAGKKGEAEGKPWQLAAGDLFGRLKNSLGNWKNLANDVKERERKLNFDFPEKDLRRAYIAEFAEALEMEVEAVTKLLKTQSLDDFQSKARFCRDSWTSMMVRAGNIRRVLNEVVP